MPRSQTYLPDVNVWLALTSRRHIHHQIASDWLQTVAEEPVVFCRITQMGLLRLITNHHVMREDVLTLSEAWKVYRRFAGDARIQFLPEPQGIEAAFHDLTLKRHPATTVWTYAYLQVFGKLTGARIVSFDRGFARLGEREALILSN